MVCSNSSNAVVFSCAVTAEQCHDKQNLYACVCVCVGVCVRVYVCVCVNRILLAFAARTFVFVFVFDSTGRQVTHTGAPTARGLMSYHGSFAATG